MPSAVSLFSGCGGSDKGLLSAGFEVLMANDIHPYSAAVYKANLPETDYRTCSIEEVTAFPSANLLAGCYPCQGFSQAGARKADRKINYLYLEFARALSEIKPRVFIVENVSGMRRHDFRHLLDSQLRVFSECGYNVTWRELNACDFGVAQERRRIFIVGIRTDLGIDYEFPTPSYGPTRDHPYVSIGEALEGMPLWPEGEYFDDPFHWYYLSRNRRRGWDQLSKTIVSHPRHMPLHPLSPELKRIHTDKWEWASDGPKRRFSYQEAALLQGFEKNLEFPETASIRSKYLAVGNAVPPPLFEAVANAIPADVWI